MSAYTAGAAGWVKERYLRKRRVLPVLTVGTEAANAIAVTIAMRTYEDSGNEYVAADEAVTLECVLVDNNGLEALVAAWTMAETGDGAEVSATAQPRLIVTTDASGSAQVTITDVSGIATNTMHLLVRPLNVPGFPGYTSVTFA